MIVSPLLANILNASLCGLMSFGLLFTPYQFMRGGQLQASWFDENHLPEKKEHRLWYQGQFMGFLMLGGCVIPTLISPESQLLCYQMSIIHGAMIVHTILFMASSLYDEAHPKACSGIIQWLFSLLMNVALFTVSLLASLHGTPDEAGASNTVVTKTIANIVMLAFSSTFALLFVLAPRYVLSGFWEEEEQEGGNDICGFKILDVLDVEKWWLRCCGITIAGLNLGVAVDLNVAHPLYTTSSLITVSVLTLHNLHQLTMRPYESMNAWQMKISWLPTLLMSSVVIVLLACALITTV